MLEIENRDRLSGGVLDDEVHRGRAELQAELSQEFRNNLGRNEFAAATLASSVMIERHRLRAIDEHERKQLEQALLRTSVEVSAAVQARLRGDFSCEPGDRLLKVAVPRRALDCAVEEQAVETNTPKLCFSQLAKAFVARQVAGRIWDAQTAHQARKSYCLFVELCGTSR